MIDMNTFLPEPVISLPSSGEKLNLHGTAPPRETNVYDPRLRILYVDDEPPLRRLVELLLVRSGYAVDTAADGVEAWAALDGREYQLLITDNDMPRLTGLELIRKVRLARMHVRVILVSGMLGACLIDPWLECGATLAKPFTAEKLVSVVGEVLLAGACPRTSTGIRLPELEEFDVSRKPYEGWGINVN